MISIAICEYTRGSLGSFKIVCPPSAACWSKNAMRFCRMESAMCVVDRAYIKTVRTTMVMLIGDVLLVCRLRGPLRELRTLFR